MWYHAMGDRKPRYDRSVSALAWPPRLQPHPALVLEQAIDVVDPRPHLGRRAGLAVQRGVRSAVHPADSAPWSTRAASNAAHASAPRPSRRDGMVVWE